jgi:hypothetical protein
VIQKIEHICKSISLDDQRIHLALEVKTSFGSSTPATGSSTEFSSQKPEVSTDNRHQHHRKEEKENMRIKSYKAKLK